VFNLTVKIKCSANDDFGAYRLVCSYFEFLAEQRDSAAVADSFILCGQASCELQPTSDNQIWQGVFLLPDPENLEPNLNIKIKAPDGSSIYDAMHKLGKDIAPLEISATPKSYSKLAPSTPAENAKAILRGQVVDSNGKTTVAGAQVSLIAGRENDTEEILAVTTTDAQGFFSVEYLYAQLSSVFVKVSNCVPQPISLVNGRLPKKVIVSVVLPSDQTRGAEDDCACAVPVPFLPDTEDIINAPEVYTSDLSSGCVVLNKPNRTVEEFDFYGVVRTTEPEIVGLTLPEPQYLHPSRIPQMARPKFRPIADPLKGDSPTKVDAPNDLPPKADAPIEPSKPTRPPKNVPPNTDPRQPGRASALRSDINPMSNHAVVAESVTPESAATSLKFIDPKILKQLAKGSGYTDEVIAAAAKKTEETQIDNALSRAVSTVPSRAELTIENPLDWDEQPTFYQAATVAHGHILHFKQIWKASGFSLGDLLYSMPLAPGQKRQVAILDWERREVASRTESLEAEESLTANLTRDRDINEIVSASLKENVVGASLALTASKGSSEGSSGPGSGAQSALMMVAGSAAGIGGGASVGFQHGSRQASSTSLQQIRDRIGQAASAVRSQRSTVVQSVAQGETLRAQTEVLANYNHCHAITVEYFEVLRHFAVDHKIVEVQECLFVPLLMSPFDNEKTLRWREALQRSVKDRRLLPAFDSLYRIVHNYEGADAPSGSYADEEITQIEGMLRISFRLVRPADKESVSPLPDLSAWAGISSLIGINPTQFFQNNLANSTDRDKTFIDLLGKEITEELIDRIEVYAVGDSDKLLSLRLDLASEFKNKTPLQVKVRSKNLSKLTRNDVKNVELKVRPLTPDSTLAQLLPPGTRMTLEFFQLRYQTKHLHHDLAVSGRNSHNLLEKDGVFIPAPVSQAELRNPRNEDKERVNVLMRHLHDNIEHYHRAIWQAMDSSRRFMLLDGITAPNANGRSVASVVENRLLGIVGNSLVLPVVPGMKLDPVYEIDPDQPVSLLDAYTPDTATPPLLISIPTKGVYAEAVMGSCNSCEKKDETRFWRWEESPLPDQPSPISILNTDSRHTTAPDLTAKDFAAPIINLQNAPSAPDPTGLAAVIQLLGKGDAFRDLTGLNQNQLNAAAALGAGMQAAGDASKLALQKSMMSNIGQLEEQVQRAVNNGMLTQEQGQEIMGKAFDKAVGADVGRAPRELERLERDEPQTGGNAQSGGKPPDVLGQQQGGTTSGSVFTIVGDSPANRSFNPPSDISGVVTFKVDDADSVKWDVVEVSTADPKGEISIESEESKETRIFAVKPGRVDLKCTRTKAGKVASKILQLSVPLFTKVFLLKDTSLLLPLLDGKKTGLIKSADIGTFESFVETYVMSVNTPSIQSKDDYLFSFRAGLLNSVRTVVEAIVKVGNMRLLWNFDVKVDKPSNYDQDSLNLAVILSNFPGRVKDGKVIDANELPGFTDPFDRDVHRPQRLSCVFPASMNNYVTNVPKPFLAMERINDYWFNFDHSLDAVAFELKLNLVAEILGRWLGAILAHELGHTMAGLLIQKGGTTSVDHSEVSGDLLQLGGKLTFTEVTGFEVKPAEADVFPEPDSLIDIGIDSIIKLKSNPSGDPNLGSIDMIKKHYPIL